MDLIPATAGIDASGRCIVRAQRLVRVKFVALPVETPPGKASGETRFPGGHRLRGSAIRRVLSRVFGRLVAARP